MEDHREEINRKLMEAELKVTPQRVAILEAVHGLRNHPTADNIIAYTRDKYPHMATGTVYNVLDTLVERGLIRRVKTDRDAMRYDAIMESHHHLYCADSERIEDYFDEDLDRVLKEYFGKKGIPGFRIGEIRLQIKGRFDQENNK